MQLTFWLINCAKRFCFGCLHFSVSSTNDHADDYDDNRDIVSVRFLFFFFSSVYVWQQNQRKTVEPPMQDHNQKREFHTNAFSINKIERRKKKNV